MSVRRSAQATDLAGIALIALATTLMLQAMRVFVSYLVFVVDQSNRLELGVAVFIVFVASALAAALHRSIGVQRSLVFSVALLAVGRLGVQFIEHPTTRLIFAAVTVASWGWVFISAVESRQARYGFGLTLGLTLDLLIRIGVTTVDLPLMPSVTDHVLALGLVVALGATLWYIAQQPLRAPLPGSKYPLIAIGPCLAAYHLLSGNLGLAQLKISNDFVPASAALAGSTVLGLLIALALTEGRPTNRWQQVAAPLVGLSSIYTLWYYYDRPTVGDGQFTILSPFAVIAILLTLVLAVDGRPRLWDQAPRRTTLWFTLGLVVQAALLFAYYSDTGSAGVVIVAGALLALGAFAASPMETANPLRKLQWRLWIGATALAIVVCGLQWLTWSSPTSGDPVGDDLTIISWNIQSGFSIDNYWDLERQARVIEEQDPDVVVLQEVSRGWLVTTYADQLLWLSQRLDMPYVWGPASNDDLWGNAILSRAPLSEVSLLKFRTTENLNRSAVRAKVATTSGDVWIVATHLDNPANAGAVRLEQAQQLIEFRDGLTPALVAGDFNATPDSDVLAAATSSGLVDSGASLGPGAVTSEFGQRIDYILATPDLELVNIQIIDTDASDHRALVATYRVGPAAASP